MKAALRIMVGSALLLSACQEATEPTAPMPGPQAARIQEDAGYGGVFIDNGVPTAYVKDLSQASAVRASLAAFARENGYAPEEIQIRQGLMSVQEGQDALERATHAAFAMNGTVFADFDESVNRVVVGVNAPGLAGAARAALQRAGLMDGTYDVVVSPEIHQAATLRDKFDPTQAGIQIHFTQYVCTLGANAYEGTQRSFITNSHCTATQGGVENTVYYQSSSSVDPTVIATEVEDPSYWKGGVCPRGKKCRYSDSSRALYSAARGSTLGAIATTTGINNGSLTVAGSINFTGKSNNVTVGMTVNKIGRTTGWTQGTVSRTCVNTGVQGSQVLQLCQHWVQNNNASIVDSGDSGSSVWTGTNSATIVGLLWGGSSDNHTFIFSPIGQVEQELGTLTFF